MISPRTIFFLAISAIVALTGCSLQKEIELDLPEPERRLVVECYLQPGQPYFLAVQEESGFFDTIANKRKAPPVTAEITYGTGANAKKITLQELDAASLAALGQLLGVEAPQFIDQLAALGYVRIYYALETVPEDYTSEFTLTVRDTAGRVVTGKTNIMSPVAIDSTKSVWNQDTTRANSLTFATDDGAQANFYRRVLRKYEVSYDTLVQNGVVTYDSTRVRTIQQDFTSNDDIYNGGILAFGTGFDFKRGDTIVTELYHISKAYYEYIESVQFAQQANGSPFGQPSSIKSTVTGGLGVFAGFSLASKTVVIGQ